MTGKRATQRPGPARGERGQSTLEFALVLFLLMALLLFYVQLALMMGYGNYAHYATFMSARAYLSAGPDQMDQTTRATSVIVRMVKRPNQEGVDRFPSIARADGEGEPKGVQISPPDKFSPTNKEFSWLQGVRYSFKSRLFLIPLGAGSGARASMGASQVKLKSESWLGREPSYVDCQGEMSERKGIFDNGC